MKKVNTRFIFAIIINIYRYLNTLFISKIKPMTAFLKNHFVTMDDFTFFLVRLKAHLLNLLITFYILSYLYNHVDPTISQLKMQSSNLH